MKGEDVGASIARPCGFVCRGGHWPSVVVLEEVTQKIHAQRTAGGKALQLQNFTTGMKT